MKYIKIILSSLLVVFSSLSFAEVAVIVNAANADALDKEEVGKIFLGKVKKFPSGNSIIPINLSSGDAIRDGFDETVLEKSPKQVKSYWSKLVFTGKGTPPQEVGSAADMLQLVSSNPDAIGYIPADQVNDTVKVLFTY
ncbi:phosphate ABC transporter substrate-binding protein [Marinicellulosiphila megalodicopiae]|uniref:phosphate ABC transporter substrate-binding protein n=1 Tax=Marinicellulosiphila megalodicopiae TaxID=2724896 RepID=UPI003BB0263D